MIVGRAVPVVKKNLSLMVQQRPMGGRGVRIFIRDFDKTLEGAGVDVVKTPFRAPNANAYAERWVLSVKGECLDPS